MWDTLRLTLDLAFVALGVIVDVLLLLRGWPHGIIGCGYVGLPLALHFAEAGHRVLGFDTDPAKVFRPETRKLQNELG